MIIKELTVGRVATCCYVLSKEDRDDCIVIPAGAVYKENGTYYVLKAENNLAVSSPISVLYSSGTEIAVADGLSEGEEILNNIDQEGIKDGMRIR